ncbi:uncharacterized protein LOC109828265 [Asparagus officinalis]|uniref:uncharacterized protein LOC109828265 n=1 Tax=Asparagus officinalis TaxID=4686 RepID=UPI00098DF234|nr:uncharacterized protein LOC109828265 [Asparagus officinalis]
MRMFAYGVFAEFVDDYVRIGESTTIESVKRFVKVVVAIFAYEYLRSPNNGDIRRLLEIGSHNDINVLERSNLFTELTEGRAPPVKYSIMERSNLFTELTEGRAPPVKYSINLHEYTMRYYIADGIYPQWSTFVKTISAPQVNKRKIFAQAQESARKDVERAFGGPPSTLCNYERDINQCDFNYDAIDESPTISLSRERTPQFLEIIQAHHRIRDRQTHSQLQADLIEHLWQHHGRD